MSCAEEEKPAHTHTRERERGEQRKDFGARFSTHIHSSPEKREEKMSVRGTLQLSKMSIFYCPRTGTSRGVLRFLDRLLNRGKDDENTTATKAAAASSERDDDVVFKRIIIKGVFSVHQTRGRDPHLRCVYLSGKEKTIDLKNKSEEEVARLVASCASEKGEKKKKTTMKGGRVRRTRRESVQGAWAAGAL